MDQNFFQTPFDLDFFPSIRFPPAAGLSDPFNIFSRRKDSLMSLGSPSSRFKSQMAFDFQNPAQFDTTSLALPIKSEDLAHEQNNALKLDSHLKNWQGAGAIGPVDGALDSFVNRDFAFDAYQICRSRGGSFNFGRFRRDSEDLFHSNPDFFKNFGNIADTRNTLENAFQSIVSFPRYRKASEKFPQAQEPHSPKLLMEPSSSFADELHGLNLHENLTAMLQRHEGMAGMSQGSLTLAASAKNTGSTMDSAADQEDGEDDISEEGGKKMLLNNRAEVKVEAKTVGKVGRPKKVVSEQVKLTKTKSLKSSKKASAQDNSSAAAKETNNKAQSASKPIETKIEATQATATATYPNLGVIEGLGQLKVPENLKQILEGPNIPKEVQEFFKNSYSSLFDTKKIGGLTPAERRVKVERYLEKRKKRSYCRRVNYDCRKRVADNRLRIKGRFVTREQAFGLMEEIGVPFNPETITNPEIKTILTEKMGSSILKKRKIGEQAGEEKEYNEKEGEFDEEDDD